MTIDDLRERLKQCYVVVTAWHEKHDMRPHRPSMRETWQFAQQYVDDLKDPESRRITFREEYHRMVVNFAKAGELYYYAKKHGIKAAIQWRITKE